MSDDLNFDVFLSHSSKDKPKVRSIAERLRNDGLRVWFDEWEIRPGDNIPAKLEEGLEKSRVLILCLSCNAFGSDWAQLEAGTFRFRDPLNKLRRFIPVRLDNTPIKGSVAQFLYIDWRDEKDGNAYIRLLDACRPITKSQIEVGQALRAQLARSRIQESTMKRVYAMSRNECAMPDCKSPLIIGEAVVGEICHIRERQKCSPRYDATLTSAAKNSFENLILICSTCSSLIENSGDEFSAEWLASVKRQHEDRTVRPLEITPTDACAAMLILRQHTARTTKTKRRPPLGGLQGTATHGGVAIVIGGANQAPINIRTSSQNSTGSNYPANSIGADANMTNYIEYLCDLYVKFMRPVESDEKVSWAKLGRHIKNKFHLKKRTRNHLSAERFWDLVDFLVGEKLAVTPVGRKHLKDGKKLCRTFDEFRYGKM